MVINHMQGKQQRTFNNEPSTICVLLKFEGARLFDEEDGSIMVLTHL